MPMLHFDLDELFKDLIPEEKSKKQNSTDKEHTDKIGRVSREVPQAQQPPGVATLLNNSTGSTDSTELVETRHTPAEEALIQSYINWLTHCQPGDEWEMPAPWLPDSDELRHAADERVRLSNSKLRIWRTGKTHLVCKVWFGPEPPPYKKYSQETHRFRRNDQERIRTMWSPEEGWMEWNPSKDDYVAMSQGSESRR